MQQFKHKLHGVISNGAGAGLHIILKKYSFWNYWQHNLIIS